MGEGKDIDAEGNRVRIGFQGYPTAWDVQETNVNPASAITPPRHIVYLGDPALHTFLYADHLHS